MALEDTDTDLDLELPGAGEDDPQEGAIDSALEDGADGLDDDEDGEEKKKGPKAGKGEKPAKTPAKEKPKVRTQAELKRLTEEGENFKMSSEERKRTQVAMQFKLKTEEELDAKMAELAGQVKASEKKTKEPNKKSPPASQPPEGDLEDDPQDDDTDDDSDDPLSLLPNVPKGDKAKAKEVIKALTRRSESYGRFNNSLKEFGLESPEQAVEALRTLQNIDQAIGEKLRTPEGLRALYEEYKDMGITMPTTLGQGAPASGAPGAPAGQPQAAGASLDLFKGMDDGEYLSVGEVRKALPALIQEAVKAAIPGAIGPMQGKFQKLAPVLEQLAAKSERETKLSAALRDMGTAAAKMANFNPSYKFKDGLDVIWAESVEADGSMKAEPHPEWPKLEKLMQLRQKAMKAGYPNLPAFLGEQMLTRGGLHRMQKDAKTAERRNILQNQAKRLQPQVNNGRKAPADTFKIPKTPEEAEALKKSNPDHYARWREMIKRGEIRVKG